MSGILLQVDIEAAGTSSAWEVLRYVSYNPGSSLAHFLQVRDSQQSKIPGVDLQSSSLGLLLYLFCDDFEQEADWPRFYRAGLSGALQREEC